MDQFREPEGAGGVCSGGTENPEDRTAEWIEGIRRGDADAFDAVAREYAPRLFRLALRLCGRREEAEDLVQETLVRTLPALKRFEGRARLSTYLTRSLGNLWKNRLRSRKRSRIVDWFRGRKDDDREEEPHARMADESPSQLEVLESEERAGQVRDAVQRLEPVRRWTLLLREVEELSYEEIASITGVPVGTVRSRLARAREEMRKILGGRP